MKVRVMAEIEVEAPDSEFACMQVSEALRQAYSGSGSEPKTWVKPDDAGRDPRLDPKPGDRVKKVGSRREIIREVRRVDGGMVQYVADGESVVCRLSTWLNWCAKAQVLEREVNGDSKTEESTGVPVHEVRERGSLPLDGESPVLPETH